MEYNLMEVFSTDLPSDFHPTMSVEGFGIVVVADRHASKVYNITAENFIHYYDIPQSHQFTILYCSEPTGFFLVGDLHGQATVWNFSYDDDDDDPGFTKQIINASTPVTAFVDGYIAHNQIVSKLGPPTYNLDERTADRGFDHRVTVPGNDPVTLMHKFRDTLICFAGPNIIQYNAYNLQLYHHQSIHEAGSVLCFAHDKYVVYPTGVFELFDYDGENFNFLSVIDNFNVGDDDVKAVSACAFGNYVAILFDNRQLSISTEINNRMQQVAEIEVEALGQLCGPSSGHAFTLVTRDKIIRYSLSGQDVSASEGSDSSSDSSDSSDSSEDAVSDEEDPAESLMVDPFPSVRQIAQDFRANLRTQTQQLREMFPDSAEEPSSAAGGRGTKRPASDPHKVKAEVMRLIQKLSKQERIALLEDLNSEKCPVCLDEYNNPEDAEKDPVLGECGHTVCKVCEPRLQEPKKCPSCRQIWKPAEFALLLV